jgi:hypothetical protein
LVALIILKKVKVGLKLANGFGGSYILYIASDLVENNIRECFESECCVFQSFVIL